MTLERGERNLGPTGSEQERLRKRKVAWLPPLIIVSRKLTFTKLGLLLNKAKNYGVFSEIRTY